MKKNIFLIAYVISVGAYLTVRLLDCPKVFSFLVQPLIHLTLGGYYLVSVHKRSQFYLLALLFTMVGSLFFIGKNSLEYFTIGLFVSFMANMTYLLLIVHKMGIVRMKDVMIKALIIYSLLALIVYNFFTVFIGVKLLIFLYSISLALLLAFVFIYNKTFFTRTKLLLLTGVLMLVVRDVFTGLTTLSKIDGPYYILIDVAAHALAMFFICQTLVEEERSEIR